MYLFRPFVSVWQPSRNAGWLKKQQQITRRAKKNVLFNEGKTKPIGLVTSPFRLPQCVRVCARACRLVSKKEKQILVGFFSPKKKKKNPFFPAFSRPLLPRPLPLSRKRQQKKEKKPTNPTATLGRPWVSPVSVKVSLRGVGWRHYRGFVHIYIYINVYISTRKKTAKTNEARTKRNSWRVRLQDENLCFCFFCRVSFWFLLVTFFTLTIFFL